MKRYGLVLAAAVGVALVLALFVRAPRRSTPERASAATVRVDSLSVAFADGTAEPALASVAVGHRVHLTLVNRAQETMSVKLAGYEDRVTSPMLAPGASWTTTFDADRPGEAFAWLVDGEPRGTLAVTGSHLEEGHR